jgi:hypothetical protein
MNRTELDTTLKWTEAEGWNPGRHDADIFWATDPSGFLVAEVNGAGGWHWSRRSVRTQHFFSWTIYGPT